MIEIDKRKEGLFIGLLLPTTHHIALRAIIIAP